MNRQVLFADHLEHLRGAERIDVNVFRDLGHVATVSRLVKYHVNLVERGGDGVAIAHIAFDKFDVLVDPGRFAAPMRLRLEIVEHAHRPAFANKQIGKV